MCDRLYREERKINVYSSIEAVLKQFQIKAVACRKESTKCYIRQFFYKATFALLSVRVGGWKPSEQRKQPRGKIWNKHELSAMLYGLKSSLFSRKCIRKANVVICLSFQAQPLCEQLSQERTVIVEESPKLMLIFLKELILSQVLKFVF